MIRTRASSAGRSRQPGLRRIQGTRTGRTPSASGQVVHVALVGLLDASDEGRVIAVSGQPLCERDRLDRGAADVQAGDDRTIRTGSARTAARPCPRQRDADRPAPTPRARGGSCPSRSHRTAIPAGRQRGLSSTTIPASPDQEHARAQYGRRRRRPVRSQDGDRAEARLALPPARPPRVAGCAEYEQQSVGQVVAPAGHERHPAASAREADQRCVEDRQAGEQRTDQNSGVSARRVPGGCHRQRGHEEAERHAAAVPEEDPGRAGQIPGQEAGASAGQRERQSPATSIWPLIAASAPIPAAATAATVAQAPSRLSIRLNALTTPTTQTIVSARSTAPGQAVLQPSPASKNATAAPLRQAAAT